jgi:17beta-estradiol 17-dehydrogenase / very-long-chain 3-oxoacyl-CoA reductase
VHRSKSLRGLIINVGSVAGSLPTPLLAVYGGSKSYLADWSTALQREYARDGVDVDCSIAAFVVSKMSKRSRPSALIPLPQAFVKVTSLAIVAVLKV